MSMSSPCSRLCTGESGRGDLPPTYEVTLVREPAVAGEMNKLRPAAAYECSSLAAGILPELKPSISWLSSAAATLLTLELFYYLPESSLLDVVNLKLLRLYSEAYFECPLKNTMPAA